MFQKSQKRDFCILKLELLIMQAQKFGKINRTILSLIFGLSVA